MLELVDLFRDQGTVDDLGFGAIRDAFGDTLFPGTSTLHTRVRYVLFIPWLLQRAAHKRTEAEMKSEFRRLEFRLIDSLLQGNAGVGILGSAARRELKRLPSSTYWAALGHWGIRTRDYSVDAFFRHELDARALQGRRPASEDPESRLYDVGTGIDPNLPASPGDLLNGTNFDLTGDEAGYLYERIITSSAGTAFAWLLGNPPTETVDNVWELPNLAEGPLAVRTTIDHARRFQIAVYGANLTYNFLLARKAKNDELIDRYEMGLGKWREEVADAEVGNGWSRAEFWSIPEASRKIPTPTRTFVNAWLDYVEGGPERVPGNAISDLIVVREQRLKGARARFSNQSALDRWSGAVGLNRLTYRWDYARSHIDDVITGMNS